MTTPTTTIASGERSPASGAPVTQQPANATTFELRACPRCHEPGALGGGYVHECPGEPRSQLRWWNRLFKREEINGDGRCPTYLYRWTLLKVGKLFSVYLHKFVGEDWSRDLHDHPKRFWSIGLRGSYVEWTNALGHDFMPSDARDNWRSPCGASWQDIDTGGFVFCRKLRYQHHEGRLFRAPWFRTFPAEHTHRLTGPTPERPCWTLVVVGRPVREWGFWVANEWIPFRRYITSDAADRGKVCP